MRRLSKYVLVFMAMLWLTGCVVSISNNFGDNNQIDKRMDDLFLSQEYDATSKNNRRR